jgi:hypothetical protein
MPISLSEDIHAYAGKIIGCHIAESNHPVPIRLSGFVSGSSSISPLCLTTEHDPVFVEFRDKVIAEHGSGGDLIDPVWSGLLGHGGLGYTYDTQLSAPTELYTDILLGLIRLKIKIILRTEESLELRRAFSDCFPNPSNTLETG